MSNINLNLNSNDDYKSLKEAIFKRAREKAEALNAELKSSYTSDIKNDVMESARVSVRNNPFINLLLEEETVVEKTETKELNKEIQHSREWGLTKQRRQAHSKISNQLYTAAVREGAMREASETIRQNQNIMNSLVFLNTQAAIQLNRRYSVHFEEPIATKEITFGI